MKIACLGWGSLVWDPRELPIRREWFKDGPLAPIEFIRQSLDGRITLAIDRRPRAAPVRLLWTLMVPTDLPTAKEALCDREGIKRENCSSLIGTWPAEAAIPILDLRAWATARSLNAVIWTALPPTFKDKPRSPSATEVIEYLRTLVGSCRHDAKQYIERAPRQIDTDYRRQIEAALGWSCKDSGGGS